jgi:8-oxo-dGTP pyrophosphatase MutT (NUDIX family)
MTYPVLQSHEVYDGQIITVHVDTVQMPDGCSADREVVSHPDSVAVVALDDQQRLLLIGQYRHPVGRKLWELPAGLRDRDGEPPLDTARRELAEETGLRAATWETLVDLHPSPGMSTEAVRVYLATELEAHGRDGEAAGEETDLEQRWLPLALALEEVLSGAITNGLAVAGLLAVCGHAGITSTTIRVAEADWPG